MRARQGETSTPMGVYIDVHEQGAQRFDAVLRRIYAFALEALFGTINNIFLQGSRKRRKQSTVACNTHNKRLVFFGVLLRVQKGFAGDYVKLYVHTLLVEIGTDKRNEFRQ